MLIVVAPVPSDSPKTREHSALLLGELLDEAGIKWRLAAPTRKYEDKGGFLGLRGSVIFGSRRSRSKTNPQPPE